MKQYYNYETINAFLKDKIREFLHEVGIRYELSSCFGGWHFEILCNENELATVNSWLEQMA